MSVKRVVEVENKTQALRFYAKEDDNFYKVEANRSQDLNNSNRNKIFEVFNSKEECNK